ncbi:MAG: T9SS type A sorting domain-containing protein [Weeksellaceae bacterium]|nr:T9SS type A sorting domain-containing protein [Bacteroidota bacterium]MCG2780291.1 T9SS type A sorting domain-containing protein [Weeksellaceae bacterium]
MKTKLLAPVFLGVFGMFFNHVNAQEFQPLLIQSGFNADVIANGTGPAASSTTNDVDGVSFALISRDYQLTSTSPALTHGLPVSGNFSSEVANPQGLSYQLASYSANNSLRLQNNSQSGTLTLTAPTPAVSLYMLAASGSGASTVNISIHFSDNSIQNIDGIGLSDWYGGSNAAIQGVGRINIDNDGIESGSNPRLYQIPLAMDAANQSKPIQSITVTKVNGGIANIFAFSANLYNACAAPTNISHTSSADNAVLTWSAPASAPSAGYDYYYSTSSSAPLATTAPTGSVPAGVTSVSLNGLAAGTTYYFWVRSNCGPTKGFWQMKQFTAGQLTFTYTAGDINTMYTNVSPAGTTSSSCPGILTISVPEGYKIKSTSVSYSMSAINGGYMAEQVSLLACQNNGETETSVSAGSGFSGGTYTYSRTGLSLANGLTGDVTFQLRAWRLWGESGCDTTYNKVDNNTFKISVTLEPADVLATGNSLKENNLKIYPNPFTNILYISNIDQVKEILISDAAGRLVKRLQKTGSALELSDLKQGPYLISLKMNDGTVQSFKTIKK